MCSIVEHTGGAAATKSDDRYNPGVGAASYLIRDLGQERVLSVDGTEYRTHYSERVIRMLIARKGIERAPLYFPFKETRGRHFLERLFRYLAARGARDLRVLEVGCSFGHVTEYLAESPLIRAITSFDVDPAFADITRAKVEEMGLAKVTQVLCLSDEETTRLPFADGAFDLVLAVGVVEHLPARARHRYVDEYYRVLRPGGHIAMLDTPNRAFPLETHSIGLPAIQWLPARVAFGYARALRPGRLRGVPFAEFDASAWRNASWREIHPTSGRGALVDVTEEAGYGWRFFRETARSRLRRAAIPLFALPCAALRTAGMSPSRALPYFNVVFRKRDNV
jgi:SAM-dependent methyltransferase